MPLVFAAAAARFGFVEVSHATTPTGGLADGIVRTVLTAPRKSLVTVTTGGKLEAVAGRRPKGIVGPFLSQAD